MTTVAPNPASPYADADPRYRHIFPSPIFFPTPKPGGLLPAACDLMAVVPEDLIETQPGAGLPEGLCPACVTVMQGGKAPAHASSECGECGTATWHGVLCAICRQDKHEVWWPTRTEQPARTNTADRVNADGSTTIKVKRACNGCGQLLGDIDDRDIDEHGSLTDVRAECRHCALLVELEAAGCKTWQLTPRNISRVDDEVDRDQIYAKGYFEWDGDKTVCVGLRIGTGETRVVARYGDHVIRHLDGRWSVHKAPAESSGEPS